MRFASEKTEKVTLKQRSVTYNEFNEEVEDWDSNDAELYAEFFERHGKEGESGGQVLVVADTRCKVRYRTAFDKTAGSKPERDCRIVRGSVTYDIESVIPVGRREGFKLMLKYRDNV